MTLAVQICMPRMAPLLSLAGTVELGHLFTVPLHLPVMSVITCGNELYARATVCFAARRCLFNKEVTEMSRWFISVYLSCMGNVLTQYFGGYNLGAC